MQTFKLLYYIHPVFLRQTHKSKYLRVQIKINLFAYILGKDKGYCYSGDIDPSIISL